MKQYEQNKMILYLVGGITTLTALTALFRPSFTGVAEKVVYMVLGGLMTALNTQHKEEGE